MFTSPFPSQVAFCLKSQGQIGGIESEVPLHPSESSLVSNSSAKRQQEFWLGRCAAHEALAALGLEPALTFVGQGRRGEPLWPLGIVGSISHTNLVAAAAAARRADVAGLGLDLIDIDRRLHNDISRYIARDPEHSWISAEEQLAHWRTLALFSAKETIFKALYPIVQQHISFKDAELTWHEDRQCFACELIRDLGCGFVRGRTLTVHLKQAGALLMTYLVLPN